MSRAGSRATGLGPAVFGRNGQGCRRCHDTIESRASGRDGRMYYWCPGCQVRLDPQLMCPLPPEVAPGRYFLYRRLC